MKWKSNKNKSDDDNDNILPDVSQCSVYVEGLPPMDQVQGEAWCHKNGIKCNLNNTKQFYGNFDGISFKTKGEYLQYINKK